MGHVQELEIRDDMSELEKYVREQAMAYVDSTIFSSCLSTNHENILNVVAKGKEAIPYVIKIYKEKGEYSPQNMYTHFFLICMQLVYGNPFEGYVDMNFAERYWLKRYEHNLLDNYENATKEQDEEFVCDLLQCKKEDLPKLVSVDSTFKNPEENNKNDEKVN